jgi:tripartite-type tricarboxylate transporter receptor subunit TctC
LITRRSLLGATLALPFVARARAMPSIVMPMLSLVVGSLPGRGADLSARAFAPYLERHLRQVRVAVLNRPGEAGLTALRLVADADPASGAIGWVASPTLPARMVDRPEGEGLLDRLRLVGAAQKEPIVFVSCPRTRLASVGALLNRAGEDAGAMPLGTPPEGSAGHLAALRLQALSGVALNIVAFPSSAAARQAAQAGNVAAAALAMGDALEGLRDGTLTGLGIAARRPSRAMPTVAPLRDSGLVLSASILRGLALPVAADAGRVATLEAALRGVVADPEFIAAGDESGFQATLVAGEAWTTHMREEHATLDAMWHAAPWSTGPAG